MGLNQKISEFNPEALLSSSALNEDIDLSKIGVGKLFNMLTFPQIWKLGGVLLTVLALVAGGAYDLGGGKWPWEEEPNKQMQSTQKPRG